MIEARRFFAVGALCALLVGCAEGTSNQAPRVPLSEKITITRFEVDAADAAFLGVAKRVGAASFEDQLERKLNAELAGIGNGPEKVVANVEVDFAYVHIGLLSSTIYTNISGGQRNGTLSGRVVAELGGKLGDKATDQQALDRAFDEYVSQLRAAILKN